MRFRFTIRDLLWLTLGVGLAVGWWIDHKHYSRRLAELGVEVRPLGTYNVSDLVIPVRPSNQ
jgi:hypothetical protein